jgi:hypothetical protein
MRGVAYAACVVVVYAVCGTGAAVCWVGGKLMQLKDRR